MGKCLLAIEEPQPLGVERSGTESDGAHPIDVIDGPRNHHSRIQIIRGPGEKPGGRAVARNQNTFRISTKGKSGIIPGRAGTKALTAFCALNILFLAVRPSPAAASSNPFLATAHPFHVNRQTEEFPFRSGSSSVRCKFPHANQPRQLGEITALHNRLENGVAATAELEFCLSRDNGRSETSAPPDTPPENRLLSKSIDIFPRIEMLGPPSVPKTEMKSNILPDGRISPTRAALLYQHSRIESKFSIRKSNGERAPFGQGLGDATKNCQLQLGKGKRRTEPKRGEPNI
ncbi:hypothetical protein K0M31_012494 [Melipona bicolor]|uniref:Uncharacterized protein n=1 Tax=Melipona bicolor TaxID=60889 RepID=A0AA40KHH1_9HYME|nr:hypothetical protein K0M31_012494 [Melipona bicolor]